MKLKIPVPPNASPALRDAILATQSNLQAALETVNREDQGLLVTAAAQGLAEWQTAPETSVGTVST